MAFSLRARFVFPVDGPPIEYGVVTVAGERIVGIGTGKSGPDVLDLGNTALLPGLVNAHTHLEFSHLRRPLGNAGMSLADWIRLVIAERGRGDLHRQASLDAGVAESVEAGVTTVGDISTCTSFKPFADLAATRFHEVIGFSRARGQSALAAVVERVDAGQTVVDESDATEGEQLKFGISPHAPYTVSPQLLESLIELARQRNMPVAMHLAESREELEFLSRGTGPFQELLEERSMWDAEAVPGGSRPLDYIRLLSEAPRSLVVHGNYLADDELAFMGERSERMSLVYCPRTHAYFGNPPYPLQKALAAGVRVVFGTDSRASNPNLSLLEEMRYVRRVHPAISSADVLRMGTLAGAESLGIGDSAGSLAVGKLANIIAVPLPATARSESDALETVLMSDVQPSHVWARGRKLISSATPDAD